LVSRVSGSSVRRTQRAERAEQAAEGQSEAPQTADGTESPERTQVSSQTRRASRARAMSGTANLRAQLDEAVGTAGPETKPLYSMGILRRGSRDSMAVIDLQQQLNARGANLTVDGDFGPTTQEAVRAFQREQGLVPDGVVGPKTRQAFRDTASVATSTGPMDGAGNAPTAGLLRKGAEGPAVESLQTRLNAAMGAGLTVDGDFGNLTKAAVEQFQLRAGLDIDGVAGPNTMRALAEVEAGTRDLDAAPTPGSSGPARPTGPKSAQVTVDGNTFNVHNMVRREFGRRSVPGNRIIALDSNSVSGRSGEVLRPLIIIPNNATPAERQAAQQAVDKVAQWINDNTPGGGRHTTGLVRTTAQNGRGLSGFFHTELFSVNDTEVTNLIKERPQAFARILGQTLGQVPGANFIVPHGNRNRRGITDPGAVSADGSVSEISLGRHIIEEGFKRL
jgi:peptidoglycan hydrolase-like protein with peptidoglycan-binding domain